MTLLSAWESVETSHIFNIKKYGILLANATCHFYFTFFERYLIFCNSNKTNGCSSRLPSEIYEEFNALSTITLREKIITRDGFRDTSSTALQNCCSGKFIKIHSKIPVFSLKNIPTKLLPCEFCEILLNSFFNKERCYCNLVNVFLLCKGT